MAMRLLALILALTTMSPAFALQRGGGRDRDKDREAPDRPETPTRDGSRTSDTQKSNVSTLKSDLAAIKSGSQVTQEQKDSLKNSLTAIADGATKPDPVLVQNLANDLSSALSDSSLSAKEKAQLANDVEKVLNSANIPPAEVEAAIADAKTILTASGVSQADAQKIANDLKAIGTELQKNAKNAQNAQNAAQNAPPPPEAPTGERRKLRQR